MKTIKTLVTVILVAISLNCMSQTKFQKEQSSKEIFASSAFISTLNHSCTHSYSKSEDNLSTIMETQEHELMYVAPKIEEFNENELEQDLINAADLNYYSTNKNI